MCFIRRDGQPEHLCSASVQTPCPIGSLRSDDCESDAFRSWPTLVGAQRYCLLWCTTGGRVYMSAYLETRSCIIYIAKVPAWPQWLHRISRSLQLQSRGGTACQIPIYRMDLAKSCTGVAPALASHDTALWPCVTQVDFTQASLTVCRLRMM